MLPPDEVIEALLAPSTQVTRRVDIYEEDGVTPYFLDAPFTDGAVSVDMTRDDRRNFDLTLDNTQGDFDHSPDELWYDKKFKLYRGVEWAGGSWEACLGSFIADSISSQSFPHTISCKGKDYTKVLQEDKFPLSTTFTAGQRVDEVIKTIAINGGIYDFSFPVTEKTLNADATFEKESARWDAIKSIATAYGFEAFFNGVGSLVLRPFQDPLLTPPSFVFETGSPRGSIVDWKKSSSDANIYNEVVVYGDVDTTGLPVYGIAQNNDPNSVTSIPRMKRRKTLPYTSSVVTTSDQAAELASAMLKVNSLEDFTLDMSTLVLPWFEAGEIVGISFERFNFLLSTFTIPLKLGAMNPTTKRVILV